MTDLVVIGDATLYLGDCLEILPTLPKVDAVVTDPPYGVGVDYGAFSDTRENVAELARRIWPSLSTAADRVALTPGIGNERAWPRPDWTFCWFYGGGANWSPWGANGWQPIMFWGRCPYRVAFNHTRPDAVNLNRPAERDGHPCPKPLPFMLWMVERFSLQSQSVLDPFMGSGTTGVACAQLGRRFIGIEIEPKYFEIACRRIEDAQRQGKLFEPEPEPKQASLL